MKKQNIKSKAKNKKSEVKKIVKTKEIKKVQYEPKNIENKWIKIWDKQKTYKTKIYLKKKKMHVMDMFPYPSGEGLHVGHVKNFGASDTYTRFKRMQGFNVLHAQGYDAFGLPAEQFAIKMKTNPKIQTKKNTDNFRKQMEMVGFSYDWDREINTTDPEFYKWTQWIFKQLYKKGLCYESFEPINWCPSCKTGLANEDLEDGKCERCSSVVEKKPIRQWVIKITEYAEKLLAGLDDVNWKENIKEMQRNWIGKSTGSEIDFKIIFKTEKYKNAEPGVIPVFTTRPDTLFGATYMVLAPEHTWVKMALEKHSGIFENETEVKKYVEEAKSKTEIERSAEGREKTGVKLEGVMAINPANGEEIPVYIADYVLVNYGTGAIMAVPAHDERDFEFAKKYNIELVQVVNSDKMIEGKIYTGSGALINSGKFNGMESGEAKKKITEFVGGKMVTKYKLREWVFARQRYWGEPFPIVFSEEIDKNGNKIKKNYVVADKELPVILPDVKNYEPTGDGESPLKNITKWVEIYGFINRDGEFETVENLTSKKEKVYLGTGKRKIRKSLETVERRVVDAVITDGKGNYFILKDKNGNIKFVGGGIEKGESEIEAITKEVKEETGFKDFTVTKKYSQKIVYKGFHDNKNMNVVCPGYFYEVILNSEKRSKSEIEDGKHEMLKLNKEEVLKKLTFEWHIFAFENYLKNKFTKIQKFFRETNTMPQWAGSSWYWLRYMDPKNKKALVDKKVEKYWGQVDIYLGGMEHATRHLIYGRFWNRFLYDQKVISTKEPFNRLEAVGIVLGEGGVKMSKRLGNVINPDDMVKQFGADTLRLYIAFAASYHDSFSWDTKSIVGPRRFIERVWAMQYKVSKEKNTNEEAETVLHQTIKKVGEDYERLSFNTAVAQLMIFVNVIEKLEKVNIEDYKILLKLLAPICPFFTEEIWKNLGEKKSIHLSTWPKFDQKKTINKNITFAIQINGKVRGEFEGVVDMKDEDVVKLCKETETYKKWITEAGVIEPRKIIVVKNKLVNVVV